MENPELIHQLLSNLGENPDREGLKKTPQRVSDMWQHMTRGYHEDAEKLLSDAICEETYNQMILVKAIDFYSTCEHHMVPFFGKVHVGYIPDGNIIGISKISRLVDIYAHRLQLQERLTHQIASALQKHLTPKGVGVVVEARHLCMEMRGVEKQNSLITTSSMLGEFHDESQARNEFLHLIYGSKTL